ncbi:MAG: hypothetical protein HFJ20_07085, partial [Clostridia bacterium]|nr:hypothetical protein [Clostridia bacterium]
NEAGFKDTNEEDNIGEATIVLSIKTGEAVSIMIIMMIITSLGMCGYMWVALINKKLPNINEIKFLNK